MLFKVSLITEEDTDVLRKCLLEWYFPYDPILLATGRTDPGETQVQYNLDFLSEGTSLKAINENGDIVGFVLAGESDDKTAKKLIRQIETTNCEYFAKILKFYLSWEIATHFEDILPRKKWFTIHVLAVDPSYRQKGVMKSLVNECVQLAKRLNYSYITADMSSYYGAKWMQKLGWDCLICLPLVYFNDPREEETLFKQPKLPHLHVSTYCLKFGDPNPENRTT